MPEEPVLHWEPREGMAVRTRTKLSTTTGMAIHADYLAQRRASTEGMLMGYVPGHGGDVWWVRHLHGAAPYALDELVPLEGDLERMDLWMRIISKK